jgi:general secretion pathway protein G
MQQKFSASTVRIERRAFTLLELLGVIVIIGILVGMIVGISHWAQLKSAITRTRAEIAAMEAALVAYHADHGQFPTGDGSTNSSAVVHQALAGGARVYYQFRPNQLRLTGTTTNILDPFGVAYRYRTGGNNMSSFDLWSYGPDGRSSNPAEQQDDITNWKGQ